MNSNIVDLEELMMIKFVNYCNFYKYE